MKEMNDIEKQFFKICDCLQYIKINTLFFIRVFENNNAIVLSNKNKFTNEHKTIITHMTGIFLKKMTFGHQYLKIWTKKIYNFFLLIDADKKIKSGFTVGFCSNKYIDFFCFGTEMLDFEMKNFFLNYVDLIYRFILYFKSKLSINLDVNSLSSFIYHKKNFKEFLKITENKITKTNNNYITNIFNKKILLTQKEVDYLILLSNGHSLKNIAKLKNKSIRTVESAINRIKEKSGYNKKSELITAFVFKKRKNYGRYFKHQ